jgi:hypothetical protein
MLVPTTPDLVLKLAPASGGNEILSFYAQSGFAYQVQYKNALTDATWTDVGASITGDDTTQTITDTGANGASQRFYRVQATPAP